MEWFYDLVENISGISHEWAALLVPLGLFIGVVILLIILKPWSAIKYQREESQREPSSSEGLSDQQKEFKERILDAGVDWILEIGINQNLERVTKEEPIGFDFSDIKRVVAAWAGYVRDVRKGNLCRWILELQDGRYIYVRGWFDPSRHEERTPLFTWSADTAEEAAQIEIQPDKLVRKGYKKKDQDVRMDQDVYYAFLDQIRSGERDWSGFKR